MGKTVSTIGLAGMMAGILDISAAFIMFGLRGVAPVRILQGIASGLLGKQAYAGGTVTALLGAMLHLLIATTAAAIFYFASRKMALLIQHPIFCGLLYGVLIYAFMNGVVLPLSNVFPRPQYSVTAVVIGALILMFLVGLPIALIVQRANRQMDRFEKAYTSDWDLSRPR